MSDRHRVKAGKGRHVLGALGWAEWWAGCLDYPSVGTVDWMVRHNGSLGNSDSSEWCSMTSEATRQQVATVHPHRRHRSEKVQLQRNKTGSAGKEDQILARRNPQGGSVNVFKELTEPLSPN